MVYVKIGSSEPEERICLLKPHIHNVPHTLPPVKPLAGISLGRQKYLYKEIRPFLDDDKKDLMHHAKKAWLITMTLHSSRLLASAEGIDYLLVILGQE